MNRVFTVKLRLTVHVLLVLYFISILLCFVALSFQPSCRVAKVPVGHQRRRHDAPQVKQLTHPPAQRGGREGKEPCCRYPQPPQANSKGRAVIIAAVERGNRGGDAHMYTHFDAILTQVDTQP